MANNIKGITIELNGETTKLDKAIKETSANSRNLKNELSQVERQLKFDPKNTVLLAQKQELLTKSINETGNRLDVLKEAEKQVQEQFAKGEASEEQYRAIQREVINTQQELDTLKQKATDSTNAFETVADAAGKVSEKTEALGNALMPVTAAVGALTAGAVAAWNEMDAGYDTIILKTGATDEALESLTHSMDEVFSSIPTDAETAGVAIGEVNTRFGATDKTLEDLSKQFIEFAEINQTDLNSAIDNTDKILDIFQLDASQAGNVLGLMTAEGQKTGLSMDSLYQQLEANGSALKDLGLDITESVTLLGEMEAGGVNSSVALGGLRKAQQQAVKDGKDFSTALSESVSQIKGASTETEALQIATETFGKKAGPELAQAIREGRFSIDDLGSALEDYGSVVSDTFEATLDPPDQLKVTLNNLKVAGADLASVGMEMVQPMLTSLTDKVKTVTDWFRNLDDGQKQMIIRILAVAAAIAPGLLAFSKLSSGVSMVAGWIGNLSSKIAGAGGLTKVLAGLANPVTAVIAVIAALAAGFIYLYRTNDTFRAKVQALVETLKAKFAEMRGNLEPVIEALKAGFHEFLALAQEVLGQIVNFVLAVVTGIVDAAPEIIDTVENTISYFTNIFQAFIALFNGDFDGFLKHLRAALSSWINAAKSMIKAVIKFITSFCKSFGVDIRKIFKEIWSSIKSVFTGVGSWFTSRFREAYNGIVSVFSGIGSWAAGRWSAVKSAFTGVAAYFSGIFSGAWTSIKNAFSGWATYWSGLWSTIKTTFSGLGTSIANAIGGAVKSGINGVISSIESTINSGISAINGAIGIINAIPGVSIGNISSVRLPRLAKGGILQSGSAIVAEAGPELLQNINGKTVVTPLTKSAKNTPAPGKKGDTHIHVTIKEFVNNRAEDIRELTEEIMEIAQELKEREDAAYA